MVGYISDKLGGRAFVSGVALIISIPMLWIYYVASTSSLGVHLTVLFLMSIAVSGPYALVSSAVAADLGCHPSLKGILFSPIPNH
ncbi:MAG TPA: hypothetical protein V6C97_30245 [Oculatellaceae cyanobacterium]